VSPHTQAAGEGAQTISTSIPEAGVLDVLASANAN
jgi:hypothetical protein